MKNSSTVTKCFKYQLLILLIIASIVSCAQQPIQFTLDGKKYTIPEFKEDSVQSFNNDLVQDGIIHSIKESTADVEIRFYMPSSISTEGIIFTIKSQADTFVCNKYFYKYHGFYLRNNFENLGTAKSKNFKGGIVHRIISNIQTKQDWKAVFIELEKNDFFLMADQANLLDSLKKANVKVVDLLEGAIDYNPKATILCEIKIGNKFRNFRILARDLYNGNETINQFLKNRKILYIIHNIFNF